MKGALWHAVVGTAMGVAVGSASTVTSDAILSVLRPTLPSGVGAAVLEGVVSGSSAAIFLLIGEVALTRYQKVDDPLFRIFYYDVVFHNTDTVYGFERAISAIFSAFRSSGQRWSPGPVISRPGAAAPGPRYSPGPVISKSEPSSGPRYSPGPVISKCGDCTATGKSCGGCGGH